MKIDMSEEAVTNRLKTVNQLRKACLSLANSSEGKKIREQFSANKSVLVPSKVRIVGILLKGR